MGGHIFRERGIETVRIPANAALPLADQVMAALREVEACAPASVAPSRLAPAYRSKPDYGDLDIIVSNRLIETLGDEYIRESLSARLGSPIAKHRPDVNDPTLALALHVPGQGMFQIDLITAADHAMDFTQGYFSWNDTGSYIGRVARQMGLRFGQGGLAMLLSYEDGTRLPISTDLDLTLEFLGFDPQAHRAGFDTPEEIYDFISTGRYFDPAIYEMDRMTNRARARVRKRPFYQKFVEAIRSRPANHTWPPQYTPHEMEFWRQRIFETFPEAQEIHSRALERQAREAAARAFFNGRRVSEITGASGSMLGHLMNTVRGEFPSTDAFHDWAIRGDEADLARRLRRAVVAHLQQAAA